MLDEAGIDINNGWLAMRFFSLLLHARQSSMKRALRKREAKWGWRCLVLFGFVPLAVSNSRRPYRMGRRRVVVAVAVRAARRNRHTFFVFSR